MMMSLAATSSSARSTTATRGFGNNRVRSGAAASSRGVVVASKTTAARVARRADWARTVSAVGNGVEPSFSRGARAARDATRDAKRGDSMGRSAVAVRDFLYSMRRTWRDRCVV
jgi:hypothetical protein